MNPIRVYAENFRTYERLDLALPEGCVAILGENGCGKSSLVSIVDLCLFGAQSRSLADCLSDTATDELLLELTFNHGGETYRVRRTYSPRGRGKTTVDFEVLAADGWMPLTEASAATTQTAIERVIGLTRETFYASSFLVQGHGGQDFTEAQPRDRKRILAEVLELDRFEPLLDWARGLHRAADTALLQLDGADQAARDLVAAKPQVERDRADAIAAVVDAADEVADRERAHLDLAQRWQEARTAAEQRRAHEAELATAQAALEQLQRHDVAATEALLAQTVTSDELATLPTGDIVELTATAQTATARVQRLRSARTERKLEIDRLAARERVLEQRRDEWSTLVEKAGQIGAAALALDEEEHASCDRCGQELHGDVRARARQSYVDEAKVYGDRANELNRWMLEEEAAIAAAYTSVGYSQVDEDAYDRSRLDEIADAEVDEMAAIAARDALHAAAARRARLEERLVALQTTIDARPAQAQLDEATQLAIARGRMLETLEAVDVAAIEREGLAAKRALDEARTGHAAAAAARARLDERLEQIQRAEEQLAQNAQRRADLQHEAHVAVELERAFGPNGIPMLIVEAAAIPQIETDANRILADLGTSYRVELRTQAALKGGDGVRDTLDVIVMTDAGERPYETFSGGERTRLNLALRIALAKLLAHRRGADSQLLAIDEPEFLDEAGTAALVDVLRSLQGDFDRIYLISHVPALRDSFDDVLTVVKGDDGRSSVVEAAVFEEVAA